MKAELLHTLTCTSVCSKEPNSKRVASCQAGNCTLISFLEICFNSAINSEGASGSEHRLPFSDAHSHQLTASCFSRCRLGARSLVHSLKSNNPAQFNNKAVAGKGNQSFPPWLSPRHRSERQGQTTREHVCQRSARRSASNCVRDHTARDQECF